MIKYYFGVKIFTSHLSAFAQQFRDDIICAIICNPCWWHKSHGLQTITLNNYIPTDFQPQLEFHYDHVSHYMTYPVCDSAIKTPI